MEIQQGTSNKNRSLINMKDTKQRLAVARGGCNTQIDPPFGVFSQIP